MVKITEPPSGMSPVYSWHYAYDGLYRLVYACSAWDAATSACLGDSFDYEYDGAGNLLAFSRWDEAGGQVETVNFVYNGANQINCLDGNGNGACGDIEDVPYTYDPYGNLTSDGVRNYSYDSANRLVSVSDGASTTIYTYNGDGDWVSQNVDGVTTTYAIDVATPLTMVLAETTGTETIYYLHGLDLAAQHDGASTEYFGYDGLGSVRQMLDGSGNVLLAQAFDPYGNPYASAGTVSTSLGYTGEQIDVNGLVFLRARYYQPSQGRFLQRDPWRGNANKPLSINPWLYVFGNPTNRTDPSGYIAQGQEAEEAEKLIDRLKATYNVRITKDWGAYWQYDYESNDPIGLRCGWQEGNWRSLRELELVEEAIKDIAPGVMSIDQFHHKFKRVRISRWNNDTLLSFAPPGLAAYVMGDIVLTNPIFGDRQDWTKFNIVHELGHVWDYRTGNRLSMGLMDALGTRVFISSIVWVWDPFASPEPYPGTPETCIDKETGLPNYSDPDCQPYSMTYGNFPLLTKPGA